MSDFSTTASLWGLDSYKMLKYGFQLINFLLFEFYPIVIYYINSEIKINIDNYQITLSIMKTLRFLGMALLAMILCVNLAACSDDDEEKGESGNLNGIIIGAWAQDGDDDIFVVNADGTGIGYEDAEFYEQNEQCYTFVWAQKNEWLELDIDFYGTLQEEELRPESVSANKIVWRRYEDYDTGTKDAFGWYDLWTWERYTK